MAWLSTGKSATGSLEQLRRDKDALAGELQSRAKSLGIKGFNPRNPAHVKKALNELGYDVKNTSASVLDKVIREHPNERFAVLILKYRKLNLKQAILNNWLNYAEGGRIYPRLSQLGGRSGRITCSKPNIQQVPRDPRLKSLFVASTGMSLVEANFLQLR